MNTINLNSICEPHTNHQSTSFTWKNICHRYSSRDDDDEGLNLYKYCVFKWEKHNDRLIHPQFIGFDKTITYPPSEQYSKWMITFFIPWRGNVESLNVIEGQTWSRQLLNIIDEFDNEFPNNIRLDIYRLKMNYEINEQVGHDYVAEDGHTPTHDRVNTQLEDAIMVNDTNIDDTDNDLEDLEHYEMSFDELFDGGTNYDWSEGHDETFESWLQTFSSNYYYSLNDNCDENESMYLFQEDIYCPENAKGDMQTFLIYLHLYQHYTWDQYFESQSQGLQQSHRDMLTPPPSIHVKVQGLPGTGKTFVINTNRNVTRNIFQSNSNDITCAPTACAASLINGSTHCRVFKIPIGRQLYNSPTDLTFNGHLNDINQWVSKWCSCFSLFMDEDSMSGRQYWSFFKHRTEESRRPKFMEDGDGHIIQNDHPIHPDVYNRPWGGIPIVYSFGDIHQLPPVMTKSISDTSPSTSPVSSDAI